MISQRRWRAPPWAALAVVAACWFWPAQTQAQYHVDLICPCTVETGNLTSVKISFGLRNYLTQGDSGPLQARLMYAELDPDGDLDSGWRELARFSMPAVAADSTLEVSTYTTAFREPFRGSTGNYQLQLKIYANGGFQQSIAWISESVEIAAGGSADSSIYFDGSPSLALGDDSAELKLPAIKNVTGGNSHQDLEVVLRATRGPALYSDTVLVSGGHELGRGLAPGAEIAEQSVNIPFELTEDDAYVHVVLQDGNNSRVAYQTVSVPDGEELPARAIKTGDASLLVDTDEDGIGDVNERLVGTDPYDADSTPQNPTIDVLALYAPDFANLYRDNPTTRISHVMSVAQTIYADSGAQFNLRLVGIVEAQIEEPSASRPRANAEFLRITAERHGADIALLFHPHTPGLPGGWAPLGGWNSNGVISVYDTPVANVAGNTRGWVAAHEIGHVLGLAHSFAQRESGIYRWSRGHGIHGSFVTVMAYPQYYGYAKSLDVFSSADRDCEGHPCGVAAGEIDGADATRSLNLTRFQFARLRESRPDSDDDGFVDPVDAFPNDAGEHLDTDGDGVGNNADADDDNDGVPDGSDAFRLDAAEWIDTDRDGVGDNADAFPNDRTETLDTDGDGVGDNADLFPSDPLETVDTDNDGVGNNGDAFPYDTREWRDTDGDGVGDNADADADGDGIANASDVFPSDPLRSDASSYQINFPDGENRFFGLSKAGDIDNDGRADFLVSNGSAYLIAVGDLAAADAADGATDRIVDAAQVVAQSNSWRFVHENASTIQSVAMVGDVDGDDVPELLVGAPYLSNRRAGWGTGAAYLISREDLPAADARDGKTDGVVQLSHIRTGAKSWLLTGGVGRGLAGFSVGALGDIDGDDLADFAVGAPGIKGERTIKGSSYLISGADLEAADEADGNKDGVIELGRVAAQANSWKLDGEIEGDLLGAASPEIHSDSNGAAQLLMSAPYYSVSDGPYIGAAYLVSMSELALADAADGSTDGVVNLGQAVPQPNSMRIVGTGSKLVTHAASIGDHDGDSEADILVRSRSRATFVSGAHLAAADASDGETDGQIAIHAQESPGTWSILSGVPYTDETGVIRKADLDGDSRAEILINDSWYRVYLVSGNDLSSIEPASEARIEDVAAGGDSWRFQFEIRDFAMAFAGDTNSDNREDLLLGTDGTVYLVLSSELSILDAADDQADGSIGLAQMTGDTDGDGIGNILDSDDDNDGFPDYEDAFPHDASDWKDSDRDGVGDNTDAFPDDWREQHDTDNDGIGDRTDTDDDGDGQADRDDQYPLDTDNDGTDNVADTDDDNDGVADADDAFPLDAAESMDSDGDGIGNVADTDDDNDGVADDDDALPLNPDESIDSDGDGFGDNIDAFDDDAEEWTDTDGDGTGNNADTDDDGDGTPDATDAFPLDAARSADADSDGVDDKADAFPSDETEWSDNDADGIGDNADTDDDNDGFTDLADAFPLDASRQRLFYYRLTGEKIAAEAGRAVAGSGDASGDGIGEVLIGSPRGSGHGIGDQQWGAHGVAYLVSGADLRGADDADGLRDGRVELQHIAGQPNSWAFTGEDWRNHLGASVSGIGDLDGDGQQEWIVGANGRRVQEMEEFRGAAFLVSAADLAAADAAGASDGVIGPRALAEQPRSWRFLVEQDSWAVYTQVSSGGDVNGDGVADLLIGVPDSGTQGRAYVVSGAHLRELDSADGTPDGTIDLASAGHHEGLWQMLGENTGDLAGDPVAAAGDIDGDGKSDIIVGAQGAQALYAVAAADLKAADKADGREDGIISLSRVAAQSASYKFNMGGVGAYSMGFSATSGDIDGDGNTELIIGEPGSSRSAGHVFLVSAADLAAADAADGASDHVVGMGQIAAQPNSWQLLGGGVVTPWGHFAGSSAGRAVGTYDIDGNGMAEVLISAPTFREDPLWCPAPGEQREPGAVYLVAESDLAAADAADGEVDGVARLENVVMERNSWKFSGEATDGLGSDVSSAGDLDGDGIPDLILGAADQFERFGECEHQPGYGLATVMSGAELPDADRLDGSEDGIVDFDGLRSALASVDFDLDGIENTIDTDDDNDGALDTADAFPFDPAERADNDNDGIGDNSDPDDDNDGVMDSIDAFQQNPYETKDSDGDGVGDNSDPDDDNDGVNDARDAFPLDPTETVDSDGDGIGDNADPEPGKPATAVRIDTDGDGIADYLDADDDNDGIKDTEDLFDLDASKSDLFFYKIVGRAKALEGGDIDGDGLDDLVINSSANYSNAYLVSSAELDAGDQANGARDRIVDFDQVEKFENSWKFLGVSRTSTLGDFSLSMADLSFAGDINGDGRGDLVAVGRSKTFVIPESSLDSADRVDGKADRVVSLSHAIASAETGAWELSGSGLGRGVYSVADLNADGQDDLIIGSSWEKRLWWNTDTFVSPNNSLYLVSGSEWLSSDRQDGSADGRVNIDQVVSRPDSWRLSSEAVIGLGAGVTASADANGDGIADLLIGAPGYSSGTNPESGAVFVLSGKDLEEADASDGIADGAIGINGGNDARLWKLISDDVWAGRSVSYAGDVDGDGLVDLIVAAEEGVYLIAGRDLLPADSADGSTDGIVHLANAIALPGSLHFKVNNYTDSHSLSGMGIGDMDRDGLSDILLTGPGKTLLISGRDLPRLHAVNGIVDFYGGVIDFENGDFPQSSWWLLFAEQGSYFDTNVSKGDLDGDGKPELVLSSFVNRNHSHAYSYVFSISELEVAARLQGVKGNQIFLDHIISRWEERPAGATR